MLIESSLCLIVVVVVVDGGWGKWRKLGSRRHASSSLLGEKQ